MDQHHSGKARLLVGVLVAVQAVLSVSGIAFAFVLRRIINMAVDGAWGSFWLRWLRWWASCWDRLYWRSRSILNEYTSSTVENRFKHQLFSALLTGDYASVAAVHSGEWMNRLTSDTTVVASGVTQIVPGLIGMLVRLLGAVAAILWLEPRFLYILLPGGAAMMLLTYAFRKILKRLHKKIQETDGALRVFLQERLESLVIVRTFAKEEQMAQQADALMDAHKAARMKRSNFSNLCNIGFAGAMDGAYLLGIGFCGYGILTGTMSYGNLMAIMQLVGQVQSPFANLTGYLPRYYSMLASAERLMEAEAFASDSTETVPEAQVLQFYQTELQALQLECVCFTYQPPVQTEENRLPCRWFCRMSV
ncbi:MAG: ABC transporter transmembrane domain-containing protein [Lachnospiraceae bacterium]